MNKRQLKKKLKNGLRHMSNEQLIDLHVNHQGNKYWPLVDREILNRFDYEVDLITMKVVASDEDDTLKLVKI